MNRDSELELLLSKLRNAKTNDRQMAKWQGAVQSELTKSPTGSRPRFSWTAQMTAVLVVGFMLGALSSRFLSREEISEPAATAQYVFSKSE